MKFSKLKHFVVLYSDALICEYANRGVHLEQHLLIRLTNSFVLDIVARISELVLFYD